MRTRGTVWCRGRARILAESRATSGVLPPRGARRPAFEPALDRGQAVGRPGQVAECRARGSCVGRMARTPSRVGGSVRGRRRRGRRLRTGPDVRSGRSPFGPDRASTGPDHLPVSAALDVLVEPGRVVRRRPASQPITGRDPSCPLKVVALSAFPRCDRDSASGLEQALAAWVQTLPPGGVQPEWDGRSGSARHYHFQANPTLRLRQQRSILSARHRRRRRRCGLARKGCRIHA